MDHATWSARLHEHTALRARILDMMLLNAAARRAREAEVVAATERRVHDLVAAFRTLDDVYAAIAPAVADGCIGLEIMRLPDGLSDEALDRAREQLNVVAAGVYNLFVHEERHLVLNMVLDADQTRVARAAGGLELKLL